LHPRKLEPLHLPQPLEVSALYYLDGEGVEAELLRIFRRELPLGELGNPRGEPFDGLLFSFLGEARELEAADYGQDFELRLRKGNRVTSRPLLLERAYLFEFFGNSCYFGRILLKSRFV